jgi:hypothetical protein
MSQSQMSIQEAYARKYGKRQSRKESKSPAKR